MAFKAIPLPGKAYLLATSLAELKAFNICDPELVDTMSIAEINKPQSADYLRAREMRGTNQRPWNRKERRQRRDSYARYIKAVHEGERKGGTPPVTMWTPSEVTYSDGQIEVPFDAVFSAHDGETQLSARFLLAGNDRRFMGVPFAVVLYTEADQELADQQLHDFNYYASPVSETDMALHNREGALTAAIRAGMAASGRDISLVVNQRSDSLGKKYLTTEARIIELAIGAAYGTDGFRLPTRKAAEKGNAQFNTLDHSRVIEECVCDFLRLSDEGMASVCKISARMLGVFYQEHNRFPIPLPNAEDVANAKASIDQRSKPLQVVAAALYKSGRKAG